MMKRTLYFFLEGNDDERFFNIILKDKFEMIYDNIKVVKYASLKPKIMEKMIKTLNSAQTDYVMLADFDDSTCMTNKKDYLRNLHSKIIESNIIISKLEIESWYLAGLNNIDSNFLRIPYHTNTEKISKINFDKHKYDKYSSRIDFMAEILKKFNFEIAVKQNASFEYFVRKYLPHCIKM